MTTDPEETRVRRVRRALELGGLRLERTRCALWPDGRTRYDIATDVGVPLASEARHLTLDQVEQWIAAKRPSDPSADRSGDASGFRGARMHVGDALRVLRRLPDRCFQCCVTSPPYWRQRDYGVRGQIGMERTLERYVAKLVAVFREVRRTLRDDGVVFLNIGDAYNNRAKIRDGSRQPSLNGAPDHRWADLAARGRTRATATCGGLKEKDLLLVPYALAAALRSDGWYLRCDIIWHKTACLPEPVKDRPTSSHEHVFLLAKSKRYFYDAQAIAEPAAPSSAARYSYAFENAKPGRGRMAVKGLRPYSGMRNARDVWSISASGGRGRGDHPATMPLELAKRCVSAGSRPGDGVLDPFAGAGTSAVAATALGRWATLVELSPRYAAEAGRRLGPLMRPGTLER